LLEIKGEDSSTRMLLEEQGSKARKKQSREVVAKMSLMF
jgi:hypothetical protein